MKIRDNDGECLFFLIYLFRVVVNGNNYFVLKIQQGKENREIDVFSSDCELKWSRNYFERQAATKYVESGINEDLNIG